ncbi:schlafen-like protein 1 [Menidia menidia]
MKERKRHFKRKSKDKRKKWYSSSTASSFWPRSPSVDSLNNSVPRTPERTIHEKDINSCESLWYGAHIGNESRTLEFKEGGGCYLQNMLYKHICVYGCAFLNSAGGSLLVGVCDNGLVRGVNLNHKLMDEVRLQVDNAVKTFHPPLIPCNYTLHFVPVIKPGDEEHNLKVLRLTFTSPPATEVPILYQVGSGDVYMRRDGSVQGPLGVSVILEWNREMWSGKVKKLEQCVYEARCKQWFLAGQFNGLLTSITPLHNIISSQLIKELKAKKMQKKMRSNVKLTASPLRAPTADTPHNSRRKRRYTT